jgi:hypothetical protein
MTKPKRPLPFDPNRQPTPFMPDPRAGELVAKASIEQTDPTFDVVLRRGDEIQHIFFRFEPSEQVWAGVIGITVPGAGAAKLYADLNSLIDGAVAEGWEIRKDTRRGR